MDNVLERLYNSEINFSVETFWDGGYNWKLGDEMNGWKEHGNCDTFAELENVITEAAIRCYPGSGFAISERNRRPTQKEG